MKHVLARLWTADEGLTLVELMVSAMVTAITLAVLITWVQAVGAVNTFQEEDFEALNDIRFAKSEMVKELRFADGVVSSGTGLIEVWLDLDESGANDAPEETVAWAISGDTLIRYTNSDLATAVVKTDAIVGTSSSITLTGTSVVMVFVADLDVSTGPDSRTIRSEVEMRNV